MSNTHLLPYHNDILTKSKIPFRKIWHSNGNGAYVWQDLTVEEGSWYTSGTVTIQQNMSNHDKGCNKIIM